MAAMTTVAQSRPFVIGVDTHARTHTFAVLRAATGEQLGCQQFPTTAPGMRRALDWAARRTGGDADTLWVIEGIGSYGAQLAGAVTDAGFEAVEAPRGYVRSQTTTGKSDPLDAAAIAAAALPLAEDRLRIPRQDEGVRAALRVLVAAREQMTLERTAKVNALTALVRIVDLGLDARHPLSGTQITEIARWRAREEDIATATARTEAVRQAKRITALQTELKENQGRITELVRASPAAPLLEENRHRASHRRSGLPRLVPPRPGPLRGRLRRPRRGQPHPGLIGEHRPAQAQPGRRQTPQPRTPHGDHHQNDLRPRHARLRRAAHR